MQHSGDRFVGREPELSVFGRAIASASTGSPSVLLVAGDAGIGKSTLVARAAADAGVPAFIGRCVPVGGDTIPLAPLVDLVRQLHRQQTVDAPRVAAAEALSAVLHSAGGASSVSHDVFTLALDLVGALGAESPVLIGVEDLHWGDLATWDLFEYLVRNLSDERVILVGTYRTEEVGRDPALRRRVAELTRVQLVERLTLTGLDRAQVAVHAAAVIGIPAPPSLVDELLRRGQGNPFFTEELVAAHLAGEAIPALLSELLEADIAALSPDARHVVGAIAAVGRETDSALLAAAVDLSEDAVETAVREALDARLITVDTAAGTYRPRHALIGEVAYATLLPSERRRLHRSIADTLQHDPRLGMQAHNTAGELAFHLDRAGEQAAAFDAMLVAADAAAPIAPAACLSHLERALHTLGCARRRLAAKPDASSVSGRQLTWPTRWATTSGRSNMHGMR